MLSMKEPAIIHKYNVSPKPAAMLLTKNIPRTTFVCKNKNVHIAYKYFIEIITLRWHHLFVDKRLNKLPEFMVSFFPPTIVFFYERMQTDKQYND